MSRVHAKACLGALATLLCIGQSAAAENWPQWRGPRADGTSLETELATEWSNTENVVWRTPLPGFAGSTPIVWEDRVFLTAGLSDPEQVALLCLNTDGGILWQKNFGSDNWRVRGNEGNAASPSPTTDGERVWAFASNGDLACYDFDGEEVWSTNLEERYGRIDVFFAFASSPVLDGDRLYIQLLHSGAWLVLALDKNTGEEIWKHERDSDARNESEQSYATSFLYRDDAREYLVVHGADYATGHSLEDGSELWRVGGLNPKDSYNGSLRFVASPVASDGLIVVPSAKNGPVLGLKADISGDITGRDEAYHWSRSRGTPDVPSPLIHDGLVYLCRENGNLICMDAETGEELYDESVYRHRHRASPVFADGKVYLMARDGRVSVVKAGRDFELVARNDMGEDVSSSPAISNGRIYLRTYDALYAIATGH